MNDYLQKKIGYLSDQMTVGHVGTIEQVLDYTPKDFTKERPNVLRQKNPNLNRYKELFK